MTEYSMVVLFKNKIPDDLRNTLETEKGLTEVKYLRSLDSVHYVMSVESKKIETLQHVRKIIQSYGGIVSNSSVKKRGYLQLLKISLPRFEIRKKKKKKSIKEEIKEKQKEGATIEQILVDELANILEESSNAKKRDGVYLTIGIMASSVLGFVLGHFFR